MLPTATTPTPRCHCRCRTAATVADRRSRRAAATIVVLPQTLLLCCQLRHAVTLTPLPPCSRCRHAAAKQPPLLPLPPPLPLPQPPPPPPPLSPSFYVVFVCATNVYAAAVLLTMPLRCHQHGCSGKLMSPPFFGMVRLPKIGRMMVWLQIWLLRRDAACRWSLVRFFYYLILL